MTVTYCDVTGKAVPQGTTNYTWSTRARRYDTLLNKDLSPDGAAALDQATYRAMGNKDRFDLMDYKATRKALLEKVTSRR
jgi:hypothetical protein